MPAPTGEDRSDDTSRLSLEPFRAVRYADVDSLARRTSPAYDLVDADDRVRLEQSDPFNIVRLILPPTNSTDSSRHRYHHAAQTLRRWRDTGVLTAESTPSLFVYEMSDGADVTRGVIGTIPVLEPGEGGVLPHEHTAAPIVDDRLALLRATQANLEPVVVAYEPSSSEPAPDPARTDPPDLTMRCDDGVLHRVWRIRDPLRIAEFQRAVRGRSAVIADGHHRYASYLAHRRQRQVTDGHGPWDRALAYLVPTTGDGLRVQAIHRVVSGIDLDTALRRAETAFRIRTENTPAVRLADIVHMLPVGTLLLTDGTRTYVLDRAAEAMTARAIGRDRSPAWRALDVVLVHRLLIETLWEIPADSQSVSVSPQVERAVELARQRGVAVLLRAPGASEVLDIARSGDLMPRKSTLFVPKPRTGIVLRCYADEL